MRRKLVAAFGCRVQGSRLYGKPLQLLDIEKNISILDNIILMTKKFPFIEEIVLGISEGIENTPFVDVAKKYGIRYIWGDQKDVLKRLVDCGRIANATDVFRVTTECPFIYFEAIEEAWKAHQKTGSDVTAIDGLPEGCHFEIYTQEALERSHNKGDDKDRSEMCSRYVRNHRSEFKVTLLDLPAPLERLNDLRLTVDYPEDLFVCRAAYMALRAKAPLIPVADIIKFLDNNPRLIEVLKPYVHPVRVWEKEVVCQS